MKKYIMMLLAVLSFTFTACDTDTEPGGTAVEKMAGDWWVTAYYQWDGEWYEAYGPFQIFTYNTAANKATEMWLDDQQNFWDFKLKVDVDYTNRTFSTDGFKDNTSYESQVKISNGKITENGTLTPSGMPADKIEFEVEFDDDEDGLVWKLEGFRRTGFSADDF